jgi:SAM-dependent methyltransferase
MSRRAPSQRPPPALARTLAGQARRALGLRQTIVVEGVRYRERTIEPLRYALSRKGAGRKEYDVQFRDGPVLRIAATAERHFADLTGPRLLPLYQRTSEWLTPGLRVVILGGGTGYAAAWVSARVGPSGAVVSLERDEQSVEFARRRYPFPNIAFDSGSVESLSGETDGSFDAAFAVSAAQQEADAPKVFAELWRVVGIPGWLFIAEASGAASGSGRARADALTASLRQVIGGTPPPTPSEEPVVRRKPEPQMSTDMQDGWITLVARRPHEE